MENDKHRRNALKILKEDLILYITKQDIDKIVKRLAQEIQEEYQGEEIILVCPLKGSVLFAADLIREINLPLKVDFVQLTSASLEKGPNDGTIKIIKDISINIFNKNVLIVEEIIDEGRILSFLKNRLLASHPASIKIVTLLDKPARRLINIQPDFIGKVIEDRFVVGYGLDDNEVGRNYADLYHLKQ